MLFGLIGPFKRTTQLTLTTHLRRCLVTKPHKNILSTHIQDDKTIIEIQIDDVITNTLHR